MKKRTFLPEEKLKVIFEGLSKQTPVNELCLKYGIAQVTYYKWRDRVLGGADKLFSMNESRELDKLRKENSKLKEALGSAVLALKKNEW